MAVWCSSSRSTGGTALHGELQHERCGESTDGLDEPALVRGFSILLDMRGRSWQLYCQPPGIGGERLAAGHARRCVLLADEHVLMLVAAAQQHRVRGAGAHACSGIARVGA